MLFMSNFNRSSFNCICYMQFYLVNIEVFLAAFIKEELLISPKLSDSDLVNTASSKDMNDIYLSEWTLHKAPSMATSANSNRTACNFKIEFCSWLKMCLPLDENRVFAFLELLYPKVSHDASKFLQYQTVHLHQLYQETHWARRWV